MHYYLHTATNYNASPFSTLEFPHPSHKLPIAYFYVPSTPET